MAEDPDRPLAMLAGCRRFSGPPDAFWRSFLQGLVEHAGARRGLLVAESPGVAGPSTAPGWKPVFRWPLEGGAFPLPVALDGREFAVLAEAAGRSGTAALPARAGGAGIVVADLESAVPAGSPAPRTLAVLAFEPGSEERLELAEEAVLPWRDVPLSYFALRGLDEARSTADRLGRVLDVTARVDAERHFDSAAMTLCNAVYESLGYERVSLGWQSGEYLRLRAVSQMERFDAKMDAVQQIEACMEESADQDVEVVVPAPAESSVIARAHEQFSRRNGIRHAASIPLRKDGRPVGAIMVEREADSITDGDLAALRVLADHAALRLDTLERSDRWWGARMAAGMRERASRLLGFEHTWAKLIGILLSIALLVIVLGRAEYRIEAEFIVKSDGLVHLPAPYDGYLADVRVRSGDVVREGDLLLQLDTSELELQEAASVAQIDRYRSDAEKAESERRLADMRAALAMQRQAEASLDVVRHRLARAEVRSPLDGVIVEGDLRERLGTPVKTGDILLEVTRLGDLYVEMRVPEEDVHEALGRETGEVAFASLPERKFPVRISQLEPSAVAEPGGNFFLARGEPENGAEEWWRPGMTGVAKINAGRRSLWWIFSHRLVDFLRLKLWW